MVEKLLKFNTQLVFRTQGAPNESPEDKILVIDTVSQNRSNAIKNREL